MGLEAMQLLGQRQLLETPCLRLPPHNFCEPSKGNSCPHTIPDIRPLPIQRPAPQVRQHDEDAPVDSIDASKGGALWLQSWDEAIGGQDDAACQASSGRSMHGSGHLHLYARLLAPLSQQIAHQ